MTAIEQGALAALRPRILRRLPAGLAQARRKPDRLVFGLPLAAGLAGMSVAIASLIVNDTDAVIAPLLAVLGGTHALAVAVGRTRTGILDRPAAVLAALTLIAALVAVLLPMWMYGGNINGIVHRTVVTAPLLLVAGTGGVTLSVRRLLDGSPSGQDLAFAPVLVVPILLAGMGFTLVLTETVISGAGTFRLDLLTTAWRQVGTDAGPAYEIGYLNNILGTLLLIALTLLFAVLPGVAAGVFISEYPGRIARIISFSTTMLRAIAMFIIGATALSVAYLASGLDSGSFLSQLIRGGLDEGGRIQAQKGSFVLAGVFLAMLVMPVIARLTEEGLRSVPRDIREGSVALGATEGYSLRRILVPWAAPNILTALILAGAEAAGGLAVIMFMATPGEGGVGPFSSVTTLDYAVFAARYGPRVYFDSMLAYQDTAALLLLVLTAGLTLVAMTLQRRFAKRYRGSLTA